MVTPMVPDAVIRGVIVIASSQAIIKEVLLWSQTESGRSFG